MSADMAQELKPHGVSCVTLYPGPVMTEEIEKASNKVINSLSFSLHTVLETWIKILRKLSCSVSRSRGSVHVV